MWQSDTHIYPRQVRKFFQDTKRGMMSGSRKLGLADALSLTTIIQFRYRALSREPRAESLRHAGIWQFGIACVLLTLFDVGRSTGKGKRSTCPTIRPLVTSAAINPPGYHNLLVVFPSSNIFIPFPYLLVPLSRPSSRNGRICTRPDFWHDL